MLWYQQLVQCSFSLLSVFAQPPLAARFFHRLPCSSASVLCQAGTIFEYSSSILYSFQDISSLRSDICLTIV